MYHPGPPGAPPPPQAGGHVNASPPESSTVRLTTEIVSDCYVAAGSGRRARTAFLQIAALVASATSRHVTSRHVVFRSSDALHLQWRSEYATPGPLHSSQTQNT